MSNHTGSYGGLAGFAGPALGDHGPVEVVRFQDLHRKHAPASAGLPEVESFGNSAGMDAPMHFGDVVAEPSFGGVEFGLVPSYGADDSAQGAPSYDELKSYPELSKGSNASKVVELQTLLTMRGYLTEADYRADGLGTFGNKTKAAVEKANIIATGRDGGGKATLATWAHLYGVSPNTKTSTSAGLLGAAASGVKSFTQSFTEQLSAPQREREREYELEMAKLAGAPAKKEEEDNTLKYALWAAGGLLGIGAIVLIVKVATSDSTSKKKES